MTFLKNISTDQSTDKELVTAFKQTGDLNFLSILYQRYMDLVFGVCLKYLKDPESSRDAAMEIFEELIRKLRQHEVDNFRGWLHVLARNYCLMQLRSPKNRRTAELDAGFMQSTESAHLSNESMEREDRLDKLEECMEQLPLEQKHSIQLFFIQKKCYNEIAQITGQEWNKVRSYIQNGKRNLKICMEAKGIVNS